jgi:uncharacterized protein (TIGR03435 family)
MRYTAVVKLTIVVALLTSVFLRAACGQTSGKTEFEVASIGTDPPQSGFHFAADVVSGGPGTTGPGIFRCSRCSLATLIIKAFNLQPYQFPGRASLTDSNYEIMAKIPAGATQEEFSAMLQNLLRNRFGLTWHFQEKSMKGYHLVLGKDGPKLTESTGTSLPRAADQHQSGAGESHNHNGAVVFGTSAAYRASNQTTADLARVLSDQIGLPVDDETGLAGKYDISLRWSRAEAAHPGNHADGGSYGGAGHGGHESGGADPSGPALLDALQQQLGLRLVPAEPAVARLFVVDRVAQRPTEN